MLKLRGKLLLFFITLSAIPLIIINLIWFNSARNDILAANARQVQLASDRAEDDVTNYFTTKLLSLIIHSQTEAVLSGNREEIQKELLNFLQQDSDIRTLSLLNKDGHEIVKVSRNGIASESALEDRSDSVEYKVPTFVGGDRYISPVYIDREGHAMVTIAIPVTTTATPRSLQRLSTSAIGAYRQESEISGVLVESIRLTDLWTVLNAIQVGKNGYTLVLDDKGNVLTSGNKTLIGKNLVHIPYITSFLRTFTDSTESAKPVAQRDNEAGNASLISEKVIPMTGWGVVAQAPVSDTLSEINKVALFALILFLITIVLITLISLYLTNLIVRPIKELAVGSKIIGAGNFDYHVSVNSKDEIEELSNAFNNMAVNLSDMFRALNRSHVNISTERNKLAFILSSITDALLVVDLQKKIILFNKAAERLTGYNAQDVLHRHIDEIISLTDANGKRLPASVYAPTLSVKREGIVFHEDSAELTALNNRKRQVTISTGEIFEGADSNIGSIITLHDITKEQELEKMKLDFVSLAAHELRTPLTAIRGYLSVIYSEIKSMLNEEQMTFFQRVETSTNQLQFLIENLLDVSRIERGAFSVTLGSIDLALLTQEVTEQLKEEAKVKHLTLHFIPPEGPLPAVSADKMRIREVLNNLIANAIHYTDKGGITIRIERLGNEVITHIADTGVGIRQEEIEHLFTKFFRVKGTLIQGTKGTGLGLYISKSIIEQHHGKLWVNSEYGRGSVFSFSLPIVMNS